MTTSLTPVSLTIPCDVHAGVQALIPAIYEHTGVRITRVEIDWTTPEESTRNAPPHIRKMRVYTDMDGK